MVPAMHATVRRPRTANEALTTFLPVCRPRVARAALRPPSPGTTESSIPNEHRGKKSCVCRAPPERSSHESEEQRGLIRRNPGARGAERRDQIERAGSSAGAPRVEAAHQQGGLIVLHGRDRG